MSLFVSAGVAALLSPPAVQSRSDIPIVLPAKGGVALVMPLAEPEGRAGTPASFTEPAPPTWLICRLTGKSDQKSDQSVRSVQINQNQFNFSKSDTQPQLLILLLLLPIAQLLILQLLLQSLLQLLVLILILLLLILTLQLLLVLSLIILLLISTITLIL